VCLIDEDSENVTIEFAVTDTGMEFLKKSKQRYLITQQASSGTSRIYGGTGPLELAIVKQFSGAQVVKMWVKLKGTTFSFRLNFQNKPASRIRNRNT
jgi:signal transduction histidine kinase